MNNCPDCGSKKLNNTAEGVICGKCGSILTENFFSGGKVI